MTNCVVYARVSTEEQRRGYSLQTQLERCTEYAQNLGYAVLEQFEDSKSGEELERPGLNMLYDFIASHPVDVMVVFDPDRLSRGGPAHTAIIEMRLEKYNVRLEYVLGDYNTQSPESALSLMIKQSIAWYENQMRRERVVRGRNAKARAGKVITGARPPYGYDYADDRLCINEEESIIVRQIYSWLLSGESTYQIARRLCEQKVPTRADKATHIAKRNSYGVWGPSSVKKILKNSTYTGKWYYNKTQTIKVNGKRKQVKRPPSEWIEIEVPVIIEPETYQAAQEKLRSNKVTSKRNTKYEYLLQGMVFCTCGTMCNCRRRGDLYYYKCPVKGGQEWVDKCSTRFGIRTTTLETLVWQAVIELLLNPEYLQAEIQKQRSSAQGRLKTFDEQLEAIKAAISDTNRKIGILLDQMLDGDFPQSVIDERRHLLTDKLRQLQSEEQRLDAERASATITGEQENILIEFAKTIRQGLDHSNFELKRKILQILRVQVHAVDKKKVKISGYIPFQEEILDVEAFVDTSLGNYARQHRQPLVLV